MAVRPFAVCAACLRKLCGILCRACQVPVPFPPVCKHSPRTCVWGAKKAGIYSILVKPIHPKEEIQIVLKRRLERIVLYFYKKSLKKTTI